MCLQLCECVSNKRKNNGLYVCLRERKRFRYRESKREKDRDSERELWGKVA